MCFCDLSSQGMQSVAVLSRHRFGSQHSLRLSFEEREFEAVDVSDAAGRALFVHDDFDGVNTFR